LISDMSQLMYNSFCMGEAELDSVIHRIKQKVERGERLSFQDGITLYRSGDLIGLGRLADLVRVRLNGDLAFYNVNRHINYTNVCVIDCQLCQGAYARKPGEDGGYAMTLDQVFAFAEQKTNDSVTEFHIVGGLNPALPFQYYLDLLVGLKLRFPTVHLKAFTMVELDFFSKITRQPLEWVIDKLKDAGMGSCPGGGAEIFAKRVRPLIAGHKISGERWLECARVLHGKGIRSNATMLYGHLETIEERVDHLIQLRELQDDTGGFNCLIPLAFHPENTVLGNLQATTGTDDLRTIAVSRLILDNFQHIKAYWVTITPALAQVALRFGADDLDGTIIEERIIHGAGSPTSPGLTRNQIEQLIRDAGCTPVERDTLYNPVARSSDNLEVQSPTSAGMTGLAS
jgi:aminodeoxyfutalosine synthase